MAVILGLIVTIPAILIIAMPFFKNKRPELESERFPREMDQIHSEREAIYKQLETLQLERDIGQFSNSEYEERVWALRLEAAENLQRQSQLMDTKDMSSLHKSEPSVLTTESHCDNDNTDH